MSDKTLNQVEIKLEMISPTFLLHTRPPRPCFLNHQGLLPMPSKIPLSPQWPIHTTTSTEHCIDKGNIHNIHIEQNSSTKEKHEHYQEKIIIVIITTPMQPKSNNEEKKKINKETTA